MQWLVVLREGALCSTSYYRYIKSGSMLPFIFSKVIYKTISRYRALQQRTSCIPIVHLFKSSYSDFTMYFSTLLISALPLIGAYAAPAPQASTTSAEEPATTAAGAAITSPTAPYGVMSARSGSPVHLLPMQARGQNFYLGGSPATYCPQPPVPSCPAGLATILGGLGSLVSFYFAQSSSPIA